MEYMQVCYRIFHEDLRPQIFQKTRSFYEQHLDTITEVDDLPTAILKYKYYEQLLHEILSSCKRQLHTITFNLTHDENTITNSILKHQQCITNYKAKIVNEYLTAQESLTIYDIAIEKSDSDIFKLIYQTLDAIILYMEEEFYKYLDLNAPMSYQRQLWHSYEFKERIEMIVHHIETGTLPKPVQQILITPLDNISTPKVNNLLNHQQHHYYIEYIESLWQWIQQTKNKPQLTALQHTLITSNYNTIKVCYYICDEIKVHLNTLTHTPEKLDVLYQHRKNYKTVISAKIPYEPELPSLKEQLLLWIDEEIEYLQQREQLSFKNSQNKATAPKQLLHLSVAEISLLIKLLHQSKLIKEPIHQVFQKIPQIIYTPNTRSISPESLSKKYYAISQSTKKALKRKLTHIISHLE